jgi:hypothetical protein
MKGVREELRVTKKKITWIEIRMEDLLALILYLGVFGGCCLGLLIGLLF